MSTIRRVLEEVVRWFRPVHIESKHALAGEFTTGGPRFGVEIFNDDKTPMEFVVAALQDDMEMSYDRAVVVMLHIHDKGSVLLPVENLSHAERVASSITAKARERGYPLTCRAASAQQAAASDARNARA